MGANGERATLVVLVVAVVVTVRGATRVGCWPIGELKSTTKRFNTAVLAAPTVPIDNTTDDTRRRRSVARQLIQIKFVTIEYIR